VFNFLKSNKKEQKTTLPQNRGLYAFTKYRRGDFVLFIKRYDDMLEFMQLPSRFQVYFTHKEFETSVNEKLLDFVECLPEDVFEVCVKNIENSCLTAP